MPVLAFKVQADWEKVVRLREEITKLKAEMRGIDAVNSPATFNTLNQRLKQCTTEFNNLTTEAVQAGAKIESGFKKRIFDAQQVVNGLSEEIIKQRKIVADTTDDLKKLTEQYRNLKANGQNLAASDMLPKLNKVKSALDEQKYALFELTQERAKEQISVKKLREEYQLFAKDSDAGTDALAKMKSQLLGMGKGLLAGMGLKELASDIIRVRGQFQQADTAITTLLGSKERADELLSQVREYAKISPLEFSDITSAAQMMLGFNIEAEKVPGFIKAIGDVSMGESGKFNSLTLAFSQMSSTGKLMGQDLNQMINAGFNPLQVMAEKTGKSIAQLKDEMSKGAITSEMVQQAFIYATSAGGKFFNMSENAAKTINGQLSMMHDAIDSALNDIGTTSEGMIVGTISDITKLIENYETVGRVLLGLATTYGTYRTAVALVTFAQNGHTLAMTIARAQILLTQKAQALLNATMLANPYVLAAVALGGLLGVVIAASDGLNAAEKAQRDFNATLEEAQKKQSDYNAETEKAINLANNDAAATGDRQGAMDLLIKRYPTIIQKYIDEEGHLRNILQLKREIAEIDGQRAVQGYQNESARFSRYAYLADQVRKAQSGGTQLTAGEKKEWEEAKKYYFEKHGWTSKITDSATDIRDYFQQMSRNFNQQAERQTAQNSVRRFQETIAGYTEAQLKQLQNALQKAKEQKGKVAFTGYSDLEGAALSQGDIAGLDKYVDGLLKAKGSTVINKAELTKRKKKLQAELDALSVEAAAGERGAALKKKIEAIDRQLGNYSTSSKRGKGGKGTTADDVEEKKTDVLSKQKLAQERAAKDLEFSTREAQIKAMQDGTDRVLAQIELDREREEEAIRRSYEDMRLKRVEEARKLWEADPKNKGKNFYETQEYAQANTNTQEETDNRDARLKAAKANYKKALEEQHDMQVQSLLDYLKEYGTFQQQKLAIAEEYAKKIREAEGDPYKQATLERQRDEDIKKAHFESLKEDMDWEGVFNNLNRYSFNFLDRLRTQLQNLLNDPNLTPENAMIVSEKISDVDRMREQKTENTFNWNNSFLEEQKRLHQEAAVATQIYNDAMSELLAAETDASTKAFQLGNDLSELGLDMNKLDGMEINLGKVKAGDVDKVIGNLGLDKNSDEAKKLKKQFDDLAKSQAKVTEKTKDATKAQKKKEEADDKSEIPVKERIAKFMQGLNEDAQKYLGDVPALFNKMGFGEIGEKVQAGLDGLNSATDAAAKFASGDYVGAALSAFDAIESFGTMLGIFGESDASLNEDMKKLTSSNERLQKSIDRLSDKMDEQTFEAIGDTYEMQLKALENMISGTQDILVRTLIAHKNGLFSSDDSAAKAIASSLSKEDLEIIRDFVKQYGGSRLAEIMSKYDVGWDGGAPLGTSWIAALGGMTPEALAKFREQYQGIWLNILKIGQEEGYKDPSDLFEQLADLANKADELQFNFFEKISRISFDDLESSFKEALMSMEEDAGDTAEEISKIMAQALIGDMYNSTYLKRLKEWYGNVAQAMQTEDKSVRNALLQDLKAEYQQMMDEARQEAQLIKDMTGYTEAYNSRNEQSATANSVRNISYEQGDAIEGRLTATQIAVEQGNTKKDAILAQATMMNVTMSDIRSIATTQSEIADDTRTILANSYLELREINEHQDKIEKAVVVIQSDVEEMKEDIKDLK